MANLDLAGINGIAKETEHVAAITADQVKDN